MPGKCTQCSAGMKFKSIQNVCQYLEKMPKFQTMGEKAARFDLEHFQRVCQAMGAPQDDFPSIHVAGTNGKGSTCQILASVYRQGGYKTGLYTSPHLLDFKERFQVNGQQISDEELLTFFQQQEGIIKSFRLTYFELSTAIAFWWFSRKKVDLALIEVGLGGRLDATNVIRPVLSIITNISLDHTRILGNTIEEIAREKAGIIKKQTPVVIGNVKPEARNEIEKIAHTLESAVWDINDLDPQWVDGECRLTVDKAEIRLQTDLVHPVQAFNIAVSWITVFVAQKQFPVKEESFLQGLKKVRKNYKNPGRFEKLHPRLQWYFDGAHNPEAVNAMIRMVSTLKPVNEAVLILAIMRDKINESVMIEFQKFKKIYYYELGSERAATLGHIKQWLPDVYAFTGEKYQREHFLKELESELVIFAGSFYFYPTVREWLQSSTLVQ